MKAEVLQTLEYDEIIARLEGLTESSLGRAMMHRLAPSSSLEEIERWQEETENAVSLLLQVGNPPLFGIRPVRAALRRAALGGTMSMAELLAVSELLREAEALREYAGEADGGTIVRTIRALFVMPALRREIQDAIIDEETMADSASRKLHSLRQSMRAKQDQVRVRLNEVLLKAAQDGHLNEQLITMRDGRYVLPVKAGSKNAVKGIVHDASGTGQTVFVEPMVVVELNNEIRALQAEEQEEIGRILQEFSINVAGFEEEIGGDEEALAFLDFTFAKAKGALQMEASRPTFNTERIIDIEQARHPLLGNKVVPIDIRLGDAFNTLIITGPNTGGKTVTLKTLGLLQAMAQAGLQIPARHPSKLGVFSNIFADIGDRQSIEQNLSTFSASMTHIVSILKEADQDALLLFDELGSGTDPTEGAAMAMAILQRLTERGIRTVATTHYAELKLFAIREEGVQNASVEFDVETLSPTYRLMIGLPGRSNAFEISRRLGLSEEILSDAQQYLDHGTVQFETVLAEIAASQAETERERTEMERERAAYQKQLLTMQQELNRAQVAYRKRMEHAEEEADRLVQDARDTAQEMIRKAKEALKGERPALDRTLNEVHEKAKGFQKRKPKKEAVHREGPKDLLVGESVKILSLNQSGILVEGPDRHGDVQVQMGIVKVRSNVKDLARIAEPEAIRVPKQARRTPGGDLSQKKAMQGTAELDVRGMRFEAAMDRIDKYLDDSVLLGYEKVRIIHGKGTGALRHGLHERLKKDRRVDSFAFADEREGGSGATDVVLR